MSVQKKNNQPHQSLKAIKNFLESDTLYCECAYVVKRPLKGLPWVESLSNSKGYLDQKNLELAHQHIILEQSGKNIGWGRDGFFSEKLNERYYTQSSCYNSEIIKKALKKYMETSQFRAKYNSIFNNCQHFVARILKHLKNI